MSVIKAIRNSLILILLTLAISACDGDSLSDDKTPPTSEVLYVGEGDTLYLSFAQNLLQARMTDNEGLSSLVVEIGSTEEERTRNDSIYLRYKKVFGKELFGKTDVTSIFYVPLPATDTITRNNIRLNLPIVEGDYLMKLICMDMAGNLDTIKYDVKLFYQTIDED